MLLLGCIDSDVCYALGVISIPSLHKANTLHYIQVHITIEVSSTEV